MAELDPEKKLNKGVNRFPVVGIGASAGGLEAFKELVQAIPANSGMAYILMQHLDPAYETALSDILQRETMLKVEDISEETELMADHIYVVPTNKVLVVNKGELQLEARPLNNQPHYSIDIFFIALAEIFQSHSIGILLSGMGGDGTLGLKRIKDHGGVTIVQSTDSAKYSGMPQHALNAEVVDFELAPAKIPQQLLKISTTLEIIPETGEYTATQAAEEDHFRQILHLLRLRRDVDFTYYKQTTIRRRILRRMLINKIEGLGEYLAVLKQSIAEQDNLYQDLLIPVTSFFRDPDSFDALCKKVLPQIFDKKNASTPVRIWVAGCSTGEEAYSIAICLHEFLGDNIAGIKLQLFATDISERSIQKARTALYSKRDTVGLSEARLQKYFIKTDGHYLVRKNIRDLCIFAVHNMLKDPPFAKMDLISCRNVLIYMESYLQKKALGTFHYALKEKCFLLLGKSETAGQSADLFKSVGKPDKLYTRVPSAGRSVRLASDHIEKLTAGVIKEKINITAGKDDFQKNADDILLAKYTPPGVVINEHFEIVQFRGSTGSFLEAAPGKASLNILKMAREGLSFEIRNALHKARDSKAPAGKADIPINNGQALVGIEVIPLLEAIEPHYLVLFREQLPVVANLNTHARPADENENSPEGIRIRQLEKELSQVREDVRSITEDQEAANEELQSANEELLSGSEELQSLNEELETSKEELQSTNEELMTVNQELYERNEQYNQARLYAEAIVATIREPILVLTRDLRIKSANKSFYEMFKFKEDEIFGRIIFELQDGSWDMPELRNQLFKVQTGQLAHLEWEVVFNLPGTEERNVMLNVLPVNPENSEQVILLAFEDITLRKKESARLEASANSLREELNVMENFFLQAPALFCILKGPKHVFEFVNPRYRTIAGGAELKGKRFVDAFPEFQNEGYLVILDNVYRTGKPFLGREMKANHYPGTDGSEVFVDLSCQPLKNRDGEIEGVLFFSYEVTEQVLARRMIEQNTEELEGKVTERTALLQSANTALAHSNRNLQEFASIASHDLQEPLRKIKTFSGILKDRFKDQLPGEAQDLIIKTQQSANRMSSLIRDVLNYSRITVPENSFVPVDLGQVINNVILDFDLMIQEKNATIEVESYLPVIQAVPLQMNQLFYNLLNNALKFSSTTEKPVISISQKLLSPANIIDYPALNPDISYAQITVHDNGIGFEQEFAEQIFSIFERLNNSQQYEGTGIGLALCRKIINNHHGIIFADSEKNLGTSFVIILPLAQ